MTLHNYEIVDCGAFCEVIFFCILPKNLLGDFFDSLSCNPQGANLAKHTRLQLVMVFHFAAALIFLGGISPEVGSDRLQLS